LAAVLHINNSNAADNSKQLYTPNLDCSGKRNGKQSAKCEFAFDAMQMNPVNRVGDLLSIYAFN